MKKYKIFIIILIIATVVVYKYIYQSHRNIKAETAQYQITSVVLNKEFNTNSIESEKKYINKTIEVSGLISELNKNDLTLNDAIFCQFNNSINQSVKINSIIKVKGRCIGYDDLLEQVKLDQCHIIK